MTLVGVEMDASYVVGLGGGLREGALALALRRHGTDVRIFDGRIEGQLAEVARRLARTRTEAYVFVHPATAETLVAELATALARLRPTARSLAVVTDTPSSDRAPAVFERRTGWNGADGTAAALLDRLPLPEETAAKRRSPYLSGVLPFEVLHRVGITLDQPEPVLRAEVEWVESQAGTSEEPLPLHAGRLAKGELLAALDSLGAKLAVFALIVPVSALCDEVVAGLERSRIVRVVLSGGGAVPARLHELSVVIDASAAITSEQRAALFACNGLTALKTGIYLDGNTLPAIYHLEMTLSTPRDVRGATYSWASAHMAIKSAAVIEGPSEDLEPELPRHRAPLREETDGWPSHVYGVARRQDSAFLHVDGAPQPVRRFEHVAFHALDVHVPRDDTHTMVTIREDEDIAELERRLVRFHDEGIIRLPHPRFPLSFENLCRYVSHGACSVGLLRRLSVRGDGVVVSCRDAGAIGTVDEAFDRLVVTARQHSQMEEVRRGCVGCDARDDCSRCSQLPSAWNGRYCAMRRTFPAMALFFELQGFLGRVAHALPADPEAFDVRVSAAGLPHQFYHGRASAGTGRTRPLILSVSDEHFVCRRGDRKVIRISPPLASVLEATWAGAADDETSRFLADRFGVSSAVATDSFARASEKLRYAGLVDA